jgi:hypothetical protein
MHTYKAQIRITSVVITTAIQADSIHNAKLLLIKLYGANSVLNVLQVN